MQLAIAWRCLRGVPADLRWRRAHRIGSRLLAPRAVGRGIAWAVAGASYALIVVNHGVGATPLLGLDLYGADWDPDDRRAYSGMCAALLVLLVAGAITIVRRPRLGADMISLGALASPLAFLWGALALARQRSPLPDRDRRTPAMASGVRRRGSVAAARRGAIHRTTSVRVDSTVWDALAARYLDGRLRSFDGDRCAFAIRRGADGKRLKAVANVMRYRDRPDNDRDCLGLDHGLEKAEGGPLLDGAPTELRQPPASGTSCSSAPTAWPATMAGFGPSA